MIPLSKKEITRSDSYRTNFIKAHPGIEFRGKHWYMCSYCGRIIPREKMQVDHVLAIDLARRNIFYRIFIPSEKQGGINSLKNLCASCQKCNSKKSNLGGWWIVKGHIGFVFFLIVWALTIAVTLYAAIMVVFGIWTPEAIRNFIEVNFTHMISDVLHQSFTQLAQGIRTALSK